ncbi:hypothetical protein [Pseudofrankia sp. BMG5.36]|uniref:hypothetical protein n=1 Tax=Pseudofrankia sp. BMG5.36 TaxID=1834512 RepID=UPI0009F44A6A
MRPRLVPARDRSYADLVRRHATDEMFAAATAAVVSGLGLVILGCSDRTGLVLAATDESLFELKMEDYSRRAVVRDRRERVLHGLIHLAVAAVAFPRPADLADDTYVGRLSVEQVDAVVRESCRMLDERAAAAEENLDPPEEAPELERTWRVYSRRTEVGGTRDSTRAMVTKAMKFLAEQGFLIQVGGDGGSTYRTTPRYQVQVRELAAGAAFDELLQLGVVVVTDGTGSLHTIRGDLLG